MQRRDLVTKAHRPGAVCLGALLILLSGEGKALAGEADHLIDRAIVVVEAGTVDPEADLRPLLDLLASTNSDEVAGDLIDAIEKLGDAGGSSPSSVKKYLRQQAPPALLVAAQKDFDWTTRSDALMTLRSLDASDADLEAAIEIARNDTSPQASFFDSRADLLQRWKDQREPASAPEAALSAATDPAKERQALEYLRRRGLGVSADQAVRAASAGQLDDLAALLDAGVRVNAVNPAGMTPLAGVTLGCIGNRTPAEKLVPVIDLLHRRGADVDLKDNVGNTLLMRATQSCGVPVVAKLIGSSADPDPVNAQGFTPLAMAMVMGKYDVAEVLIDGGAGLSEEKVDQLFVEPPSDPAVLELLERAKANAGG